MTRPGPETGLHPGFLRRITIPPTPAKRKRALTESDLLLIIESTPHHASHDDLLFNAIVLVGWHCLLRLGKLVDSDTASLQDYRKSIGCISVKFEDNP